MELVACTKLEPHTKRKLEFFARQLIDADVAGELSVEQPGGAQARCKKPAAKAWRRGCSTSRPTSRRA